MSKLTERVQGLFGATVRFLRQVGAELRRVVWPDRRQAVIFTAVVIGSVAVVALLIWVVDAVVIQAVQLLLE